MQTTSKKMSWSTETSLFPVLLIAEHIFILTKNSLLFQANIPSEGELNSAGSKKVQTQVLQIMQVLRGRKQKQLLHPKRMERKQELLNRLKILERLGLEIQHQETNTLPLDHYQRVREKVLLIGKGVTDVSWWVRWWNWCNLSAFVSVTFVAIHEKFLSLCFCWIPVVKWHWDHHFYSRFGIYR